MLPRSGAIGMQGGLVDPKILLCWLLVAALVLGAFELTANAVSAPINTQFCPANNPAFGECFQTTSDNVSTYFNNGRAGGGGLSGSPQGSSGEAPVEAAVLQYNNASVQWFITCPVAPDPSDTQEYFSTNMSGGYSYVGGDRCLASTSTITAPFGLQTEVHWAGSGGGGIADASITSFTVGKLGTAQVTDIGYSGSVCDNGQAICPNSILASSFDTESYIFNVTPSQPQQGIWTWNSKYTNLSQLDTSSGRIDQHYVFPGLQWKEDYRYDIYQTNFGPPCLKWGRGDDFPVCVNFTKYTTLKTWAWTCHYTYTFSMEAQVNHIDNTKIPIPVSENVQLDDQLSFNGRSYSPVQIDPSISGSGGVGGYFGSCAYQLANPPLLTSAYNYVTGSNQFTCNGVTYVYDGDGTVIYHGDSAPSPSGPTTVHVYNEPGAGNTYYFGYCSSWGYAGIWPFGYNNCNNWEGAYVTASSHFGGVTVLPYFLYNISMPVLATSLSGSGKSIEHLNLSFDLYSPHNYLNPGNYLAPFPVDTDSGFFATYNGSLAAYQSSAVSLKNPTPSGLSAPVSSQFVASLNRIDPSLQGFLKSSVKKGGYTSGMIPNPEFIYAAPNDYIFVMNTTSSCSFLCFSTNHDVYLYTMRFIPLGYYNVSNDQPNNKSLMANDQADWTKHWMDYWNRTGIEQGTNLYVTNITRISEVSSGGFWGLAGTSSSGGFAPTAITGDYKGDVFFLGFSTATCAYIFGCNSGSDFSLGEVAADGTRTANTMVPMVESPTTEFAASPNGQYVYIANPFGGNVPIFRVGAITECCGPASANQAFTYLGNISLSYSNSSTNMNLSAYLMKGGPFGVSRSDIPSYFNNLPTANDINADHHPIGLMDSFGTLYILDDWNFTIPCGSGCSGDVYTNILMLRAFSGNNTEIPMGSFQSRDTRPVNAQSTGVSAPSAVYVSKPLFPPYGWPLSVNVSVGSQSAPSGSLTPVWNYCSTEFATGSNGQAQQCAVERGAAYPPVGPFIPAIENYSHAGNLGNAWTYTAPGSPYSEVLAVNPSDVAFSSDFNGTVYLLSHLNSSNTAGEFQNQPLYTELLILRPQLDNYTKPALGAQSPYICYLNRTTGLTDSLCQMGEPISSLTYMKGPIAEAPSSFKFASGEGSPLSFLSIPSSLSSLLPNGAGSGNSTGTCTSSNTPQNSLIYNGVLSNSGTTGSSCAPANTLFASQPTASLVNPGAFASPTNLSSRISGYTIIPYNVTYSLTRWWKKTNLYVVPHNGPCIDITNNHPCAKYPPKPPPGYLHCDDPWQFSRGPNNPIINATTEYRFQQADASPSSNTSRIEGGPTYLEPNGTSNYYDANQSDAGLIVLPYLNYQLFTNRVFGELYINQTVTPANGGYGNTPLSPPQVINATNNYRYQESYVQQCSSLGCYDGYATELANQGKQRYGVQPGSGYYQPVTATPPLNNLLTYSSTTGTTFTLLFQLYRRSSYVDGLLLNLTGNGRVLGYNRLVYTYVDRFNNTVFMPLDADFANITSITLNVSPIVSTSSPNETALQVNGSVRYYRGFLNTTPHPLQTGTPIYLYYDTDINFFNASYPAVTRGSTLQGGYIKYEEYCRFSPTPLGCNLADPLSQLVFSNGQLVPGQTNTTGIGQAGYVTFHPQYNASGTCANESPSLLQIVNTDCNIYGDFHLPAYVLPTSARPYTLYCVPKYSNGTGVLTSQIGLMGVVHTDSKGAFNYSTNVCGTGTGKIIAQYYGYPPPEPQVFYQPSIARSSGIDEFPKSFLADYMATPEYNYSFAPNETTVSFPVGSYILSYGGISAVLAVALVAAVSLVLMLVLGRRPKRGSAWIRRD